jgi:hypothetical protein
MEVDGILAFAERVLPTSNLDDRLPGSNSRLGSRIQTFEMHDGELVDQNIASWNRAARLRRIKDIRKAEAYVKKMTPSILDRAFRGELLPTEADLARQEGREYESAAVLLERLRRAQDAPTRRSPVRWSWPRAACCSSTKSAR